VVPDLADRATIEEEHALELRTRDRERKPFKKIEQSIGRIDSGDYCDETGEAIGVGRLISGLQPICLLKRSSDASSNKNVWDWTALSIICKIRTSSPAMSQS
jgi:hypothetical protein